MMNSGIQIDRTPRPDFSDLVPRGDPTYAIAWRGDAGLSGCGCGCGECQGASGGCGCSSEGAFGHLNVVASGVDYKAPGGDCGGGCAGEAQSDPFSHYDIVASGWDQAGPLGGGCGGGSGGCGGGSQRSASGASGGAASGIDTSIGNPGIELNPPLNLPGSDWQLQPAPCMFFFDPGPPPMSEWHQEAIPDCFLHTDQYYQDRRAECARDLDTCVRPCTLPDEHAIDVATDRLTVWYIDGAYGPDPDFERLIATCLALIRQNLDLLEMPFCVHNEMIPRPDDVDPSFSVWSECVLDVLDTGDITIHVVGEHTMLITPTGGPNGIYLGENNLDWANNYASQQTDAGRMCKLIQVSNLIMHEVGHVCYGKHAGEDIRELHNHCDATTIGARMWTYNMVRRFPCATGFGCGCDRYVDDGWAYDSKGTLTIGSC